MTLTKADRNLNFRNKKRTTKPDVILVLVDTTTVADENLNSLKRRQKPENRQ